MISISYLFEKKVIKVEDKPNWTVHDFKNPPDKDIKKDSTGKPMYRRIHPPGRPDRLITIAIKNKPGKQGGTTEATSLWKKK